MIVVKDTEGVVLQKENYTIIKKVGDAGSSIPKHNHPEANVVFTVVKGVIEVTMNEDEVYELTPGKVLSFDGDNYISAKLIENSEAFVTLILK